MSTFGNPPSVGWDDKTNSIMNRAIAREQLCRAADDVYHPGLIFMLLPDTFLGV